MTYGEVASRLRETMVWLLERRRITQQLGGPGSFRVPVTSDESERAVMGREVQAYRGAVLTYCLEAVRTVTPTAIDFDGVERRRSPVVELRHHLEKTHAAQPELPALSTLMASRPSYELVARWQDAARRAVEGERDLAVLRQTSLTQAGRGVIAKDVADLVRALVTLDIRYHNVPGWEHLRQKSRLLHAAEAASQRLSIEASGVSVDALGWVPQPGFIEGAPLPGLAGVIQAQHNVAVDLGRLPSAVHLRHVLANQADLSRRAERLARSCEVRHADSFAERADLYRDLVTASRTLGGLIGSGRFAATESLAAVTRIAPGRAPGEDLEGSLLRLAQVSRRVDVRVASVIEYGFREKVYFTAITLPTMGRPGRDGIARAARKYVPVDADRPCELMALVRDRLRPTPVALAGAARSGEEQRRAFAAAIPVQRRPGRGR